MTTEEQFARIERNLADTGEILRRIVVVTERNEGRAAQMMDTFNRMGRILEKHERRLASLEGAPQT